MTKKQTLYKEQEKNLKTLKQYVPVVARVHGGTHPEFHEVRRIFEEIVAKNDRTSSTEPELIEEFLQLRAITNNYTVPSGVCESYEAVYKMLAELDGAYHNKQKESNIGKSR